MVKSSEDNYETYSRANKGNKRSTITKKNAKTLIKGKGPFRKYGSAEAHVLYIFDDLLLLAQPNFPDRYAWLLSKAMLKDSAELPGAIFPLKGKKITKIHPGVLMALNDETISQ